MLGAASRRARTSAEQRQMFVLHLSLEAETPRRLFPTNFKPKPTPRTAKPPPRRRAQSPPPRGASPAAAAAVTPPNHSARPPLPRGAARAGAAASSPRGCAGSPRAAAPAPGPGSTHSRGAPLFSRLPAARAAFGSSASHRCSVVSTIGTPQPAAAARH